MFPVLSNNIFITIVKNVNTNLDNVLRQHLLIGQEKDTSTCQTVHVLMVSQNYNYIQMGGMGIHMKGFPGITKRRKIGITEQMHQFDKINIQN